MEEEITILLVWSIVPEECHIYLLDLSPDEAELIKSADGKLVNCDDPTPGLDILTYAVCNEFGDDGSIPEYHLASMKESGVDPSWYGRFKDNELNDLPDISGMNISTVVNSGFAL